MPVTDEVAQDGRMLPVKIILRNLGGFVVALTPDFCGSPMSVTDSSMNFATASEVAGTD